MAFDLRLPLGMMFTLYGVMLTVYGLVSDKSIYQKSLGININLIWGAALLIFGATMLIFALRSRRNGKGDAPKS